MPVVPELVFGTLGCNWLTELQSHLLLSLGEVDLADGAWGGVLCTVCSAPAECQAPFGGLELLPLLLWDLGHVLLLLLGKMLSMLTGYH